MTQLIEAPAEHKQLTPINPSHVITESKVDLGDNGRDTLLNLFQLKPGEVVTKDELERRAHLARSVLNVAARAGKDETWKLPLKR